MATLSKRERVDAALRGSPVDRPPVSAWQHFIPEERSAAPLAEAHLRFFEEFDWDWLKVNPRATYYAEAWGNRYDFDTYDGVLPRLTSAAISGPHDLAALRPVSPTDGVFAEQLDLLQRIARGVGGAPFVQTIFSPLSVLAFLTTHTGDQTVDLGLQSDFGGLRQLLLEHPAAAHHALAAISETLASYAAASIEAGASGIFFAIVRLARADVLSRDEYATFGLPYDRLVLEGARRGSFNLLHICGPQAYFDLVRDYPVHAVNWAAVGQGNPTLAEARVLTNIALIGGLDESGAIQRGTPDDVRAEARAAVQAAGATGLLLSPGCGVAMDVPTENLRALRRSVEP
jgi:uroporphyrinogen decarboxylase